MARSEKIRLGDLLMQQKLLTEEQLQFALSEQKRNGHRLGRVLVDNSFITEEQISETLAKQFDIPYISLKHYNLNLEVVRRLPENQARRFRTLALEERADGLLVGMADPTDTPAIEELGRALKRSLSIAVVTEGQLLETIDRVYRRTEEISGLARELPEELGAEAPVDFGVLTESVSIEETPAIRLLQTLFGNAVQNGASGIHFELQDGRAQVRFRIDGVLHQQPGVDYKIAAMLLTRLKLMSGMDAAEKHMPQEGRFNVRVRGTALDARLAVMPTSRGESLVLHLYSHAGAPPVLDKLGMPPDMLARLREVLTLGGMLLVSGPAGSGKTATLHATAAELNSTERKVVTVEELVERSLPGITQVQVSEKMGLTFAHALRAVLRQDPDVILAGEMPDTETAQIALRAAMDGRLVLSALPAHDAAGALFRLADMGMPGYLVACAVRAVLGQCLLRRICTKCGEPHAPSAQEAAWLDQAGFPQERWQTLRRGKGCSYCHDTGYSGRLGVYEMLEMDRNLAEAVAHGDAADIRLAAHGQLQGRTLLDHALALMVQGLTSASEVMRIGSQVG